MVVIWISKNIRVH